MKTILDGLASQVAGYAKFIGLASPMALIPKNY
jgi:hypothetical protein